MENINSNAEKANAFILEYETQYEHAYTNIMQLIINKFEQENYATSGKNEVKVSQLELSAADQQGLTQGNAFFIDLYQTINILLTPEGKSLEEF